MMMSPPHHDDVKPPSASAGKSEARISSPAPKCPRCDSSNTKFCYYNNYSLAQPRHFCKTCRRYWTKGGALRNVPIGGGCRRKTTTTAAKKTPTTATTTTGLKFFEGVSPAMDFQQLNNLPKMITSPPPNYYYSSNPACSSPNFNTLATSIESLSSINQDLHWKLQRQRLAGGGMLFGAHHNNNNNNNNNANANAAAINHHHHHHQEYVDYTLPPPSFQETHHNVQTLKPQPILFQNLDIIDSKTPEMSSSCGNIIGADGGGGNNISQLSTEWFFDNSYANQTSGGGLDEQDDTNNWNGIHDFY